MKKKVLRFLLVLTLMIAYCFRPISLSQVNSVDNKLYKVGEQGLPEGRYIVTPVENNSFCGYQIAMDSSMSIEETTEAHYINKPTTIELKKGDFIKLTNCTVKKSNFKIYFNEALSGLFLFFICI
ncbi:hypothetical protein [Pseudobutyrivibrio ruminis]|uniref:Uncharacterized protein n=1 Tax=Pseudobutyrivibrio ruminis DSM 9787 TaxID=1123011 RepID=A0A285TD60_9FIRM|nr:hypothetical protein [Pseudobutyrivibrio ruminis]SOC17853.1 hypothetical protein SAMN02910411_0548 [Pseudobutyrivibrio ruminis DSM 9787]